MTRRDDVSALEMTTGRTGPRRSDPPAGREAQIASLTRLLAETVRSGTSVAVRGEPGSGRSAVLQVIVDRAVARGFRVLRCTGAQHATDDLGAGLNELLHPDRERLEFLPGPQRAALRSLLSAGVPPAPNRLVLETGVLTLLETIAREQPLLLAVDDVERLDRTTVEALSFVARRLRNVPILLVVTMRDAGPAAGRPMPWALSSVELPPLSAAVSRQIVATVAPGLPTADRDRVVAAADGNPLALREYAASIDPCSAAGTGDEELPISRRLQECRLAEVTDLPAETRRLLLLVAAAGRPPLVELVPAAHSLGLRPEDLDPAERADVLLVSGGCVGFRRDLLRRAVYAAATSSERAAAHDALAFVTQDLGHAVWHRSALSADCDQNTAAELASVAARAARRGSLSEAVRLLRRSALLSPGDEQRGHRLATAAELARQAGYSAEAGALMNAVLATAQRPGSPVLGQLALTRSILSLTAGLQYRSPDEAVASAITLVRDRVEQGTAQACEVIPVLLGAASIAWTYAVSEGTGAALRRTLEAVSSSVELGGDRLPAVMPGWSASSVFGEIPAASMLAMMRAWADPLNGAAFRARLSELTTTLGRLMVSDGEQQRRNTGRLLMATARTAETLHDIEAASKSWDLVQDALVLTGGAVTDEARRLADGAVTRVISGRVTDAVAEATRAQVLSEELGLSVTFGIASAARALAHAWSADFSAVAADVARARATGDHRQPALTSAVAGWAAGVAGLREQRHTEALAELRTAGEHATVARNSVADLVEAAVGTAEPENMAFAAARVAEEDHAASVLQSTHLSALVLRARALLAGGDETADELFGEAVEVGRRAGAPLELGRTLLSYGAWLHRHGRVIIARKYFGEAQFVFTNAGAASWALAAADQLRAAGVAVGRPSEPAVAGVLSAHEQRIAELAVSGRTNKEIAAELHCSARTVAWHLSQIYPKLGVASRWQLAEALELQAGTAAATGRVT